MHPSLEGVVCVLGEAESSTHPHLERKESGWTQLRPPDTFPGLENAEPTCMVEQGDSMSLGFQETWEARGPQLAPPQPRQLAHERTQARQPSAE